MADNVKVSNADIMDLLKTTISKDIKDIRDDLSNMRMDIGKPDERVERLEKADVSMLVEYNDALKQQEIQALVSEFNSKEYNIIIYNIPGTGKMEKRINSYIIKRSWKLSKMHLRCMMQTISTYAMCTDCQATMGNVCH